MKIPKTLLSITELLDHFQIIGRPWDALIIGDGSGQTIEDPCGWAACAFSRHYGQWHTTVGGLALGGSIGYAEIMASYSALRYMYTSKPGQLAESIVHIFTDNQATANMGNNQARRSANLDLWAAYDYLVAAAKCKLYWHWFDSEGLVCPVHSLVDQLSVNGRVYMSSAGGASELIPDISTLFPWRIDGRTQATKDQESV